jgi:cytochrome c biogenesis protein CcdA
MVELTIPTIMAAAIIDSINPCAIAVMVFLLTYLVSIGAKRRMLRVGIVYISVVFMSYFFSGLGLLAFVQVLNLGSPIFLFAAIVAMIVGIINLKDFFWYGKGFTLQIPESRKPSIQKYVKMATLPATVVLGFLVSMYELPCTGGVYIAILGLLANSMTRISAIPVLLMYNFFFVLPLIIILVAVNKGSSAEKITDWKDKNKRYMKLFSGLFMLALGLWMFSTYGAGL